jgi:hypothetical protein
LEQFICLAHIGTRWVACVFDMARKQLTTFDAHRDHSKAENFWDSHKEIARTLQHGLKKCISEFFTGWAPDWGNWTYVFLDCPQEAVDGEEPIK